MKLKGNAYFLMIIMAVVLAMIIMALQMEYYTSKLLPLIIGGFVFILAAIGLVGEIVSREKPEAAATGDEDAREAKAKEGLRIYLPISAWILGVSAAIYLVGFVIAIPVFILTYMKSHGIKWTISIISTIVTIAVIYGAFEVALGVDLYQGQLVKWLGF